MLSGNGDGVCQTSSTPGDIEQSRRKFFASFSKPPDLLIDSFF